LRLANVGRWDDIYADSAEPKSIEEISQEGFNIKPCAKGPDSVRAGIDFLKSLKIHIIDGSSHIKDEARTYKYKEDKSGRSLPIPVEFKDHAVTAVRYGIFTHCKKAQVAFHVISHDVRPD
jgi:phage terminase large subunit